MLLTPLRSPGYHTRLKAGDVHPVRESFYYAQELLNSGEEAALPRVEMILRRLIGLQDQDQASETYGLWPWFLEESLEEMNPPDWNWADFCGEALLRIKIRHADRLSPEVMELVSAATIHAARSIERRNVGPAYTNIAVLGTYVTLVASEQYGIDDLKEYAMKRMRNLHRFVTEQGAFTEYNSPTYSLVTVDALGKILNDARDREALRLTQELYRMSWEDIARHFHPPTRQWAGPHSRSYRTLLSHETLDLFQRATEGRVVFDNTPDVTRPGSGGEMTPPCPDDLDHYFSRLDDPRVVSKTYIKGESPVIGTTYLHPAFTLGSINRGSFFHQERAVVAYWGTPAQPAYLHARFLHDGYDFTAARVFSVQHEGRLLAAVTFASDAGDTHPYFDRMQNGCVKARDLRLRFELGGGAGGVAMKPPASVPGAMDLQFGDLLLRLEVPYARFGDDLVSWEPVSTNSGGSGITGVELVLHSGEERMIQWDDLGIAAIGFALEFSTGELVSSGPKANVDGERLLLEWAGLKLSAPARPDRLEKLLS